MSWLMQTGESVGTRKYNFIKLHYSSQLINSYTPQNNEEINSDAQLDDFNCNDSLLRCIGLGLYFVEAAHHLNYRFIALKNLPVSRKQHCNRGILRTYIIASRFDEAAGRNSGRTTIKIDGALRWIGLRHAHAEEPEEAPLDRNRAAILLHAQRIIFLRYRSAASVEEEGGGGAADAKITPEPEERKKKEPQNGSDHLLTGAEVKLMPSDLSMSTF